MSFEAKSFIDYFAVCGLDVKSGLEPDCSESYGIFIILLILLYSFFESLIFDVYFFLFS